MTVQLATFGSSSKVAAAVVTAKAGGGTVMVDKYLYNLEPKHGGNQYDTFVTCGFV